MNNTATPDPSLPLWVRLADGVTIVLSVLVMHVAIFGPLRVGAVLSVGEPWRAVLLLAVVVGLRHYLVRTPPVYRRVWTGLRSGWRTEACQTVWPIVVVTRLAVLLVGYLAVVSVGFPDGAPPIRVSDNEAVNLPLRWDTGWYLNIAMEGYQWSAESDGQQNIAFFPGYPLATQGVATLLGAQSVFRLPLDRPPDQAMARLQQRFLAAAVLVSLLAFAWGMVWLYRLAREHLDEPATRAALLLLAAYPFAVFFSAAYSESLMLLAVVAAFYHVKHEKWLAAAAWELLAGLTRPNGFLLAGPLAVIGLQQVLARRASGETRDRIVRHVVVAAAVAAMPLVGTLIYSGFIYSLTGDPIAWREAHRRRRLRVPCRDAVRGGADGLRYRRGADRLRRSQARRVEADRPCGPRIVDRAVAGADALPAPAAGRRSGVNAAASGRLRSSGAVRYRGRCRRRIGGPAVASCPGVPR